MIGLLSRWQPVRRDTLSSGGHDYKTEKMLPKDECTGVDLVTCFVSDFGLLAE